MALAAINTIDMWNKHPGFTQVRTVLTMIVQVNPYNALHTLDFHPVPHALFMWIDLVLFETWPLFEYQLLYESLSL